MAKDFLKIILLALVIFIGAKLGLAVATSYDNVSLLWPPTGISIAVLLLQGKKLWPGVTLGTGLATALTGAPLGFIVAAALANTVEALLATQLIQNWNVRYSLNRTYDVLKLLLIIMIITPLLASFIGSMGVCFNYDCSSEILWKVGWQWWMGNAMGALVLTPFLLSWSHPQQGNGLSLSNQTKGLIATGFLLLILTNLILFGIIPTSIFETNNYPLRYLCFPFLIWASFSLKQKGATLAIVLTVIIALRGTLQGNDIFIETQSTQTDLFIMWSFMIVVAVPTLLLAAAMTERNVAEKKLSTLAYQDSLTDLPNRSAFYQEVSYFLNLCQIESNHQSSCAVLFIDLNRFKEINDSFGHTLGDELLRQVADRIKSCIPEDDRVARLGGDEFAVFIPALQDNQKINLLIQKILQQFETHFVIGSCEFLISATIGIVIGNCHYTQAENLIRDADIAMYHAKTRRRKYCWFEPSMRHKITARLNLEQDLRRAIQENELHLVYQPIIDLQEKQTKSFEALLRWYHPQQGWISPARFIPIAEDTELIIAIGDWVLTEACHQLQQWQQQFSPKMGISLSVNVSPKQLRENDLVSHVSQLVKLYDIRPENLKLEITETAILEANAKSVLEALKALGVGLYLDDFGVGESSLHRLYQLPLDTIKVDRAFVQGIPENRRKSAIAHTIVNLAENMGLGVIAEGIETEAQTESLLNWGCDHGQGFFFSKPVLPAVATEIIAGRAPRTGEADPE